ncbi:UNVERIFIED_CONTAM: hypothetical protein K2H54_047736 [Gekko kuhli]
MLLAVLGFRLMSFLSSCQYLSCSFFYGTSLPLHSGGTRQRGGGFACYRVAHCPVTHGGPSSSLQYPFGAAEEVPPHWSILGWILFYRSQIFTRQIMYTSEGYKAIDICLLN